ncbi:CW-type domain-containing protein [Pseudoscourfieldia marina]
MDEDSFDMSQVQAALLDEALDMSFEDLPDLVGAATTTTSYWEARLVGWDASSALNYLTSKTRVQGSPHEVEFRAKFGVNRLVYDRILQELRVCHVNWAREGNRHKVFQWLKRQEGLPESVNDVYWKGPAATVAEQEHLTKYYRAAFTGKEGFPTIALNVVSGPRRSCTFIGDAQPGARNDKAICKICPSVASLRQDKSLQWELETPGGNVLNMTGATCSGLPVLVVPASFEIPRVVREVKIKLSAKRHRERHLSAGVLSAINQL